MPEATTRTGEHVGEGLFTGPVVQWLHRRGCRGMHALPEAAPGELPDWHTAPIGRYDAPVSGWRFGWTADDGRERRLLLEFGEPGELPPADRDTLAAYLALAGPCADALAGSALLIDRDAVATRLHDLRNAVNSLLMNAAVLTTKLPREERSGRFAAQVPIEGERCAKLLQSLAETIRPPDTPRAG